MKKTIRKIMRINGLFWKKINVLVDEKMHLKRYLCSTLKLSTKRKQNDAHDESKIDKKDHPKNNTDLIRKIFQSLESKQNYFSPLHFSRLI